MTERWNHKISEFMKNEKIDDFLSDIHDVCKKHNMSISHEDGHGGFIIENYEKFYFDWLCGASDNTDN